MAYVSPDGKHMPTDEMQRLSQQARPPVISADDPPSMVMAKYKTYVDAVRKLNTFAGNGSLHFGAPPASGWSGHFAYDPDELQTTINRWWRYHDDILKDRNDIRIIQNVKAPAPDVDASEMQAAALRAYGTRMMNDNAEMLRYCKMVIENMQKSLDQYKAAETQNTGNLRKQLPPERA